MKDKVICSGNSNHEKAYIVGNATNEIIPNGLIAKVERKDKLLPCPFCGSKAVIIKHKSYTGKTYYNVVCSKCRTEQGKTFTTKHYAIKVWNRRVENES